MNLRSEIEFYSELRLLDKARLLNLFLHEIAEEARGTYGPGADQVNDGTHRRFVNELTHRPTPVSTEVAPVHTRWVLVVEGNQIVAAGPEKSVHAPAGAQLVDLPHATL